MRSKRKLVAITATAFLFTGGVALAYFLALAGGSGETSEALGEGSPPPNITLSAGFAPGLVPDKNEPVTFMADNTNDQPTDIKKLTVTITTGNPGCKPGWFHVENYSPGPLAEAVEAAAGATTPISVPADTTTELGTGELRFLEEPINQSACEKQPLTVKLASTP